VGTQLVMPAMAKAATDVPAPDAAVREMGVTDWLKRMHEAGRKRSYLGTYVVSNNLGISSARIWHVCDGVQTMERVETLTGAPRSTIRSNDQVVTFTPDNKTAVVEQRENLVQFPSLLGGAAIPDYYQARLGGSDRVAGQDAQRIDIVARDALRHGYRVWADKATGLVLKIQTVDASGGVLEESAFSEIQLDASVKMDNLDSLMKANTDETRGVRVLRSQLSKTTASAEGWNLRSNVPGFKPMSCYKGPRVAQAKEPLMQWVFSDGLASVSIFVEPFDRSRHLQESSVRVGSTQTWVKRSDPYWLTFVGEVPLATLKAFASGLERKR
ncbi:MAG: hypothetical protein RLZZ271_649, partial [Pseudomonadota bacterium]